MNIYVANIASEMIEADLRSVFRAHGNVQSVRILYDEVSGRSRGFGFVEMPNEEEAAAAIDALDQLDLHGKKLSLRSADKQADAT